MATATSAAARYTPERFRRNLRVYYLFMGATGFMIFLPIWIIYLIDERGMSLTEVAVFEAVFWLVIIMAEVPTGAIADRYGRRVSLALGAILFAVASVIFAVASHFSILLASYLVMGVAMTLYSGAGDALLYDTLRVLGRTGEYERYAGRTHGLFWGMMVLATAIGGPAAYLLGYSAAILVSAVFFLVSAVAALMLREPPRRESDFPPDPLHAPPANVSHVAHEEQHSTTGGFPIWHEIREGMLMIWRIKPVRYLVPFAAVMISLFDMPRFLTQPFVASHGLDPLASAADGFIWSALLIPAYLGSMVGMLAAPKLYAQVGERRSFPLVLLFGAIFMIPLVIWNHLGLLATIFMVSIAQAAIRPIASGYINRRINSDQRATALSIFSLVVGGSMSIILIAIVPAADLVSFPFAFGVALAVTVTLGVGMWLLWRWAHRRDQAERVRRWIVAKPQASRVETTVEPPGALFPSVQNLD